MRTLPSNSSFRPRHSDARADHDVVLRATPRLRPTTVVPGPMPGQRVRGGSAKLRIKSPPRQPRSAPPDATVTNSSPFTIYTAGDAKMPAPAVYFLKRLSD